LTPNAIKVEKLNKAFGEKIVLKDYSAEFPVGEITCIMGPSGCGKTTLMHIMLGLIKADSGKISGLEGKKITAVFQEDRLCKNLNAVANIAMVCPKSIGKEQIIENLAQVGLKGDSITRPVVKLSGGMKRRVALVRAIMPESDCIFMDEPFKGLDEITRKMIINYVKHHTQGKTLLIITHDLNDIRDLKANLIKMPLVSAMDK
jgi:NitT/TauT family transport system ATP-binding protein